MKTQLTPEEKLEKYRAQRRAQKKRYYAKYPEKLKSRSKTLLKQEYPPFNIPIKAEIIYQKRIDRKVKKIIKELGRAEFLAGKKQRSADSKLRRKNRTNDPEFKARLAINSLNYNKAHIRDLKIINTRDELLIAETLTKERIDQVLRVESSRKEAKNRPENKLKAHCRESFSRAIRIIKQKQKVSYSDMFDHFGYTVADLKLHIEKLFEPWMSWDNHGEWHIDHIEPLCSFHIQHVGCNSFKRAFQLSNLRPISKEENYKKIPQDKKKSIRLNQKLNEPTNIQLPDYDDVSNQCNLVAN